MPQKSKGTCTFVATSTSKECGKPIDPEALERGVVSCPNSYHRKGLVALGIKHPEFQTLQAGYASKMQVHYAHDWPFENNKSLKEIHQDVVNGGKAARALDERDEEAKRKAALNALERGPVKAAVPANTSAEEDGSECAKAIKQLKQAASLNLAVCPEASKVLEQAAQAYMAGKQLLSVVVLPSGAVVTAAQRQAFEAIKAPAAAEPVPALPAPKGSGDDTGRSSGDQEQGSKRCAGTTEGMDGAASSKKAKTDDGNAESELPDISEVQRKAGVDDLCMKASIVPGISVRRRACLPVCRTKEEFEGVAIKHGLSYVPTEFLTDSGMMRIAGLYRTAALAGQLEGADAPDAQEGAEEWEAWLKSRRSTACFVAVNKADVTSEGWEKLIDLVWAAHKMCAAQECQSSDSDP